MNGGYVMLDYEGIELTATGAAEAVTINGIYSATKTAIESGKIVVVGNCKYESKVVSPISAFAFLFPVTDGNLVVKILNYTLNITSADTVMISAN